MQVTFIGHACFIIEHDGVRVICDPWLEGSVFNKGWQLLSPAAISYEDFKTIDYIWFSHEHPDHFHPPSLSKIPEQARKNISVLFQETKDKRVLKHCEKMGFKAVHELKKENYLALTPRFKVRCEHYQEGDSWIQFLCDDISILNLNDCWVHQKKDALQLKEKAGKVDVLLTQFSYAYWAGNKEDKKIREQVAESKLAALKLQCEVFNPIQVIPFASFIWFCHEENFYLNDSINTISDVHDFILINTAVQPLILYNGDSYQFGEKHNNDLAISKYMSDLNKVTSNPALIKTAVIESSMLIESSRYFIDNLKSKLDPFMKWLIKPTFIYLTDYHESYEISLNRGFTKAQKKKEQCDISLSSDSLWYCFKFPYGQDTLGVNGRFQKPAFGNYKRFYNFFRIPQQESRGMQVDIQYLLGVAIRKIKRKIHLE